MERRGPLEEIHRALGARLGPFGGWLMPIEHEGTLAEHRAVRERVGLFDVSHLGLVHVRGPGALALLQRTFSNDLTRIGDGAAQYELLLNERGGIEEDLLVYRLSAEHFVAVPNAANAERVAALLAGTARAVGASIEPVEERCILAVQGPRSPEVVGALFAEAVRLPYLGCVPARYGGTELVLARTGYTGERGFELLGPASVARRLWEDLLEAGGPFGITPCGLGARDVLRLEMGYPLCGQDLLADRTPLEAGLVWAVALDKPELPGRDVLLRQRAEGPPSRLLGLRTHDRRHIPRHGQRVFVGGEEAGELTSGTFSPTLGVGIGLGYLRPELGPGTEVEIDIRGRAAPAVVVRPPFVDRDPR